MSRLFILTILSSAILSGLVLWMQSGYTSRLEQLIDEEHHRILELEAAQHSKALSPQDPTRATTNPELSQTRITEGLDQILILTDQFRDVLDSRENQKVMLDVLRVIKDLSTDEIIELADQFIPTQLSHHAIRQQLYLIVAMQDSERILKREDLMADADIASTVVKQIAKGNPQAALRWIEETQRSSIASAPPSLANLYIALNYDLDRGIQLLREAKENHVDLSNYRLPLRLERLPDLGAALRGPENEDMKSDITLMMLNSGSHQEGLPGLQKVIDAFELEPYQATQAVRYRLHDYEAEEVISWFSEDDCPEEVQEMIPDFIGYWAKNDYNAAGEWLGKMDPSPLKDEAISRFAGAVVIFDPKAAAVWGTQIQDEWKRRLSIQSSLRNWRYQDPEAAQKWLQDSGLNPAEFERD